MQAGGAIANRWTARKAVWPQYLLPKQALTTFGGWVATRRWGSATTRLIAWFVNKYQVDMAQAAQPDIAAYGSFNDFFTHALRALSRPPRQPRGPGPGAGGGLPGNKSPGTEAIWRSVPAQGIGMRW